jgi:hypothetical protein
MKTKKLVKKLYGACIEHKQELEKKLYMKLLKKSLKKKDKAKTNSVQ